MSYDEQVAKAIYSKLSGDATLTALLASNTAIYAGMAPQQAAFPLVVYNLQTAPESYTLGQRAFTEDVWQIKGITKDGAWTAAGQIAARIDALLTDGTLTITGHTLLSMRRQSRLRYPEDIDGIQYRHSGGLYRLVIQ